MPATCYTATAHLAGGSYAFALTDAKDPAATLLVTTLVGTVPTSVYVYPARNQNATVALTNLAGATIGYTLPGNTACGVSVAACADTSFVDGDWTVAQTAGCLTRTRTSFNMLDGVYLNPTVTITNGVVSRVVAGSAVAAVRPDLCTGGTGSVTPGTVVVSTDPCSLLFKDVAGVLHAPVFAQAGIGSGVTVTGCGTQANPFVIGTTALASGYSRNDTCGWNISNGVVYAMPATLISSITPGPGVTVTYNSATCAATVGLSAASQVVIPVVVAAGLYGSPNTSYVINGVANLTDSTGLAATPTNIATGSVYAVTVSGTLVGYIVGP
jgi:hypothetical protein